MDDFSDSAPPLISTPNAPLTGVREIDCVRQEIRALDEAMARLQLERKRLMTLISPIHRIPLELIGEIFVFALAQHLRAPTIEGMDQLVDLCLVCRRWREVAIATPHLWSALVLNSPFTPVACSQATTWLERSKIVPKSLVIDSSMGCNERCRHREDCSLERMPLVTLLTEGPGPLRRVSLICARSVCLENLQLLLSQSQQTRECRPWDTVMTFSLETIEFWNHYEETDEVYDEGNSDYPILENLPLSVTRLSLHIAELPDGEGVDEDSPYILKLPEIVLNRLTHLTLSCNMNATTIFGILSPCRNVQVLCLDLGGTAWSNPDESNLNLDEDGDLLPALRILRIKSCDLKGARYLRALRTPHLQKLEIEFAVASPSPDNSVEDFRFAKILADYFDRSRCHSTLTHLRLHRAHVMSCYPILAKLTSLTHLALNFTGADLIPLSPLFVHLVESHMEKKPLPALKSLKSLSLLSVSEHFSHSILREWLIARRTMGLDDICVTVTQRCGQVREVDPSIYNDPLGIPSDRSGSSEQCGGYHREEEDWGFDEI